MKVLYFAPMFHTNQIPIIKGWLANGDEVIFITQYRGVTENHEYCQPIILGYSDCFEWINKIYTKLTEKKNRMSARPEAFKDRFGVPKYRRLCHILKDYYPDVVIIRERSLYSMQVYRACKKYRIKSILYNQTPLYDPEPYKGDIAHRIVRRCTPRVRMTPVYGYEKSGWRDTNSYYVPFVMDTHLSPKDRSYFADGRINILCVAKYEERKRQIMLLDALQNIASTISEWHITFVGEASTNHHKAYLKRLTDYVDSANMCERVSIVTNVLPKQMEQYYTKSDVFVLPSTAEFASISQLEAMSYSMPIILSDTNGSACQIKYGVNGYTFEDGNATDLERVLQVVLSDKSNIIRMGEQSYSLVKNEYSFNEYKKHIVDLMSKL